MKMTYVILGISVAFMGMIAMSWAQIPANDKPVAETAPTAPVVPKAPMAGGPIAPTAPAPKPPVAQAPVVQPVITPQQAAPNIPAVVPAPAALTQTPVTTQTAPVAVGGVTTPAPTTTPAANVVPNPAPVKPATEEVVLKPMTDEMANAYKDKLSFPLNDQTMIIYTQATLRVKKINAKWDVQIAGADTDPMAIEYSNFAVEEITAALKNIPGLTLAQYNEITKLASTDIEFNRVYQAYRQLIEDGKLKPTPLPAVPSPAKAAAPVAAPAASPAAAPVNSGTAPVPQGSLAPQYSPPVSR